MHMHLLETHFLACWSHWNEITYGSDLSFTIKKFDSIQIFTLSSMKLKQIPQLERTHILTVRVKFMVWHLAMIFRRIVSVYFVIIIIIIILLIMFFFYVTLSSTFRKSRKRWNYSYTQTHTFLHWTFGYCQKGSIKVNPWHLSYFKHYCHELLHILDPLTAYF